MNESKPFHLSGHFRGYDGTHPERTDARLADHDARLAACESAIAGQVVERDERTDSDSLWHGRIVALEQRLSALERRVLEADWPSLADRPDGVDIVGGPVYGLTCEQLSAACADGHVEE